GGAQPGEVKVWDLTRHQEYTAVPPIKGNRRIEAIGFSADGETVQVVRAAGELQRCEALTGLEREIRPVDGLREWIVPSELAAFRPDGGQLAAVSNGDQRIVRIVDLAGGGEPRSLAHSYEVQRVAFSRDGRRLATSATARAKGDGRREVRVWDAATARCLATIPCDRFSPGMPYGVVALRPAGRLLAYAACTTRKGEDGRGELLARARIQDLASGQTQQTPEGLRGLIRGLAFGSEGRYLAVSSDVGGIVIYDCRDERWLSREPLSGSTAETSY